MLRKDLLNILLFFSGFLSVWLGPTDVVEEFYYTLWKHTFQTKIYFRCSVDKKDLDLRLMDLYKDLFIRPQRTENKVKKVNEA